MLSTRSATVALHHALTRSAFSARLGGAIRYSSHGPVSPTSPPPRKKVTINTLRTMYRKGTPITMVTAHDFPSGLVADQSGVDMVLVGDSLAMVGLGMEDTNQVTLDDMVHHSRAVMRGVRSAFAVGDLPFGSYELSPEHALESSIKLIQKGRVEAVKLEGGKEMYKTISKITTMGVPVLGHVGLTPQRQHSLGGFRVQGKTALSAEAVLEDALAVQEAGCFAMVLEAVPAEVARIVTKELRIPTIGIGAGNATSGQVLVQIDMLGNFPEGRFMPKFVKQYGDIFAASKKAIEQYNEEVRSRSFPEAAHTYTMPAEELAEFQAQVAKRNGKQ